MIRKGAKMIRTVVARMMARKRTTQRSVIQILSRGWFANPAKKLAPVTGVLVVAAGRSLPAVFTVLKVSQCALMVNARRRLSSVVKRGSSITKKPVTQPGKEKTMRKGTKMARRVVIKIRTTKRIMIRKGAKMIRTVVARMMARKRTTQRSVIQILSRGWFANPAKKLAPVTGVLVA